MSPHAPHFVSSLPPEGALRLRPGEAGSAAPAGQEEASLLVASRTAQRSEWLTLVWKST